MNTPLQKTSPRILFVEKNKLFAKQMLKECEPHQCHAFHANTAAKALSVFRKNQFDIIFCDVSLRGCISGFQVTKRMRLLEKISGHHAHIVGMSNNPTDRQKLFAFQSGMDRLMHKCLVRGMIPYIVEIVMRGK